MVFNSLSIVICKVSLPDEFSLELHFKSFLLAAGSVARYLIHNSKQDPMFFFKSSSKQKDLYDETFRDLVQAVLDGFNGTIFAYGQTGTGKTFTMQGK